MKQNFIVKFLILLVAGLLCIGLAGCGGNKATGGMADSQTANGQNANGQTTNNGKKAFRIVTSFYPMYIATLNVADGIDGVEVVNMTRPQTGCLHDYALIPADLEKVERADAFVANGAGMESFMEKLVKHSPARVIDASRGIKLLTTEENGHQEENPHVWLSLDDAIQQVKNIAEQLGEADPSHRDAYAANGAAYIKKLQDLRQEMHALVDPLPHKDIVTFHEAFPYFAQEFNLNIVKVIEREPGTEPMPRELAETIDEVNRLPVKVLFTEPQYSPKAARTIASSTGAKIYQLDPVVTGVADAKAKDAYLDTMRQNARVLQEALR